MIDVVEPGVHVLRNNVADHCLTVLRDRRTNAEAFRSATRTLARHLVAASVADMPLVDYSVETPLEPSKGSALREPVVLIPILRAGLGMLEPALDMIPRAAVGYLGFERDETTAEAHAYYAKTPPITGRTVLLLDPMLATGGTAIQAIEAIAKSEPASIRLLAVIAAPEGVAALRKRFPDVDIYLAALDRCLDSNKYIRPGLGDFGDRLYSTM